MFNRREYCLWCRIYYIEFQCVKAMNVTSTHNSPHRRFHKISFTDTHSKHFLTSKTRTEKKTFTKLDGWKNKFVLFGLFENAQKQNKM